MKTTHIIRLLSLMFITICLINISCVEILPGDEDGPYVKPKKPDLTTKVSMTVSGFVVDENDQALENVKIQAGDSIATTNEYGYFAISSVKLVADHSFVVAEKDGYFNATRTWMGQKGATYEVRIKMLPKTVAGNFGSQGGGIIKSKQGVELSFPADAVIMADGSVYTGNVNVAIQWLDAVGDDFGQTMPGDLSAINTAGNTVTLVSYGMAAVELRGDGNELLQVAKNKKVRMTIPIASQLQSSAKESIPLWSFDESKGMWIEEGIAKKEGNTFVGEVSHFSWWNCDYPYPLVTVTGKAVNNANEPIYFAHLRVQSGSNSTYISTNSNGEFRFIMPQNTSGNLYFEVCSTQLLKSFSVGRNNLNLATLKIDVVETTIDGDVKLLVDNSVNIEGSVFLKSNNKWLFANIVNNKFKFSYISCEQSAEQASLSAECYFTYQNENKFSLAQKDITINQLQKNTTSIVLDKFEDTFDKSNYFKYEFRGTKTVIDPASVFGYNYLNISRIRGYSIGYDGYGASTDIELSWGYDDEIAKTGTFELFGILYRTPDRWTLQDLTISGTVTITEITESNDYLAPIRIKGTFEGITIDDIPRTVSSSRSDEDKIKGEFMYTGRNRYPEY